MTLENYLQDLKDSDMANCLRIDVNHEVYDKLHKTMVDTYPGLFGNLERVNFDMPLGWVNTLQPFFTRLDVCGVTITQIKQKFGELNIYLKEWNDEAGLIIQEAAEAAAEACEFCSSKESPSLWHEGYVCRVCINCKIKLAEYDILSWLTNKNTHDLNNGFTRTHLQYCKGVWQDGILRK